MRIFFMKNIPPMTTIALALGTITVGNTIQQKSIIETASAHDDMLTEPGGGEPMEQELTDEPSGELLEPQIAEEVAPEELAPMGNMDAHELPNTEEMANPDEPVELPAGYDEGFGAQAGPFPFGMQVIRTSFAANASDEPGPVEPPDPTDPHREKKWSGKRGSAKGQMDALPPVITMGEQPEDGGLTNVTPGYQPE
jgi:hypothetical protein